jgi:hypothetical protein
MPTEADTLILERLGASLCYWLDDGGTAALEEHGSARARVGIGGVTYEVTVRRIADAD